MLPVFLAAARTIAHSASISRSINGIKIGNLGKIARKVRRGAPDIVWRSAGGNQVPVLDAIFNEWNRRRISRLDELEEARITRNKKIEVDDTKFAREINRERMANRKIQEEILRKEEADRVAAAHEAAHQRAIAATFGKEEISYLQRISYDIAQLKEYMLKHGMCCDPGVEDNESSGLFKGLLGILPSGLPSLGKKILGAFGGRIGAIRNIGSKAIDLIGAGGRRIAGAAKNSAPKIKRFLGGITGSIGKSIKGLKTGAADVVARGGMLEGAKNTSSGALKGVGAIGRTAGAAKNIASSLLGVVADFENPIEAVQSAAKTGWEIGEWLNESMEGTEIGRAKDAIFNKIFSTIDVLTGGGISGNKDIAKQLQEESFLGGSTASTEQKVSDTQTAGDIKQKVASTVAGAIAQKMVDVAAQKVAGVIIPSSGDVAKKVADIISPITDDAKQKVADTIAPSIGDALMKVVDTIVPSAGATEVDEKIEKQKFQRIELQKFDRMEKIDKDLIAAINANNEKLDEMNESLKVISSDSWLEKLGDNLKNGMGFLASRFSERVRSSAQRLEEWGRKLQEGTGTGVTQRLKRFVGGVAERVGSGLESTAMKAGEIGYDLQKGSKNQLELARSFQGSKTIKGLTPEQTKAYAGNVAATESGGKVDIVNSFGFMGQYQFGADALADLGFIDKEKLARAKAEARAAGKDWYKSGLHKRFLEDPSNWINKGGREAFMKNKKIQDDLFVEYTNRNIEAGFKSGALTKESTPEQVVAYAKAAHLKGVGGANNYFLRGIDSADAYGTTVSKYAKDAAENVIALSRQVNVQPAMNKAEMSIFPLTYDNSSVTSGKIEMASANDLTRLMPVSQANIGDVVSLQTMETRKAEQQSLQPVVINAGGSAPVVVPTNKVSNTGSAPMVTRNQDSSIRRVTDALMSYGLS
jgi:hypothetical protein